MTTLFNPKLEAQNRVYNLLREIRGLEYFQPEECDSDKCDLQMAAMAAIFISHLAAIFNMVAKAHNFFRNAPITKKIDI